jgi:hypothetical protein
MARRLAVILVVALVLMLLLPMGIGMAMTGCIACHPVDLDCAVGPCAAIVLTLLLVAAGTFSPIRGSSILRRAQAIPRSLERPPRFLSPV